jgi:site-specific recombinase XerD
MIPRNVPRIKARKARGRVPQTRAKYLRWLREFERWTVGRNASASTPHEIELLYLGAWHEDFERRHGHPRSAHTVRSHIDAFRSYHAFLECFDLLDGPNPMRKISPRAPRRTNDWLSPSESEAMLQAALRVGVATSLPIKTWTHRRT